MKKPGCLCAFTLYLNLNASHLTDLFIFRRCANAWGYSVKKLLESLPDNFKCPEPLIQSGAALDKFYIPTRYPNGFDAGTPEEYYNHNDLTEAIRHAEAVIRFCKNTLL